MFIRKKSILFLNIKNQIIKKNLLIDNYLVNTTILIFLFKISIKWKEKLQKKNIKKLVKIMKFIK